MRARARGEGCRIGDLKRVQVIYTLEGYGLLFSAMHWRNTLMEHLFSALKIQMHPGRELLMPLVLACYAVQLELTLALCFFQG